MRTRLQVRVAERFPATLRRGMLAACVWLAAPPAEAAAQSRMTQDPTSVGRLPPHLTVRGALPPALGADHLIVLDPARSTALLVDPGSHEVVARLPTGPLPDGVAVAPDGRLAYVSHAHGPPGAAGAVSGGSLTVLDLERLRVRTTFQPRSYAPLYGLGLNESGSRLFVTAAADSVILELDTRDGGLLMLWRTAGSGSRALATSGDGRKLYVASSGSDSVAVIDRRTTVGHRVPTGAGPVALDLAPDGKELWVANHDDHTITVIDAVRERSVATLASGGRGPVHVRFRPGVREAWVAHHGDHAVILFDTERRAVVGKVTLPGAPFAILFSPEGDRAYVSMPEWGEIAVVDAASRRILQWIPAGNPGALAWSRRLEKAAVDP